MANYISTAQFASVIEQMYQLIFFINCSTWKEFKSSGKSNIFFNLS